VLTRLRTTFCAVLCGAFAAAAAPAQASEIWVAPSGSDAAPGTTTRPLKTIDRALESARAGDRVLVRNGTYPEMVEAGPRGTADAPIVLQPAAGEHAVVSGGFKLIDARWVRVQDMTFDGTGNPDGWGTSIWSSQHVELSGNEITGYQEAQGVLIKDRSAHVRLTANRIHHLGVRHRFEHGIYCESARQLVIAENVIHDIPHGYGIHLFGDCDGTRIVRNTIARNGLSGIIIAGNDERGTADNTLVARNVIAHHTVPAWSEYGFAVTEYQPGRGNVVRNNVFFGNVADEDMDCEACAARGNVERDPGFADAANGDFRLRADGAARARRSGAVAALRR
jgi:Right handed beta helix region